MNLEKEAERGNRVDVERMGTATPPITKSPTHRVCVECGAKLPEADMISDDKARWRCWPCVEQRYGLTRPG